MRLYTFIMETLPIELIYIIIEYLDIHSCARFLLSCRKYYYNPIWSIFLRQYKLKLCINCALKCDYKITRSRLSYCDIMYRSIRTNKNLKHIYTGSQFINILDCVTVEMQNYDVYKNIIIIVEKSKNNVVNINASEYPYWGIIASYLYI